MAIVSNFPSGESSATKAHVANTTIHITAAERAAWDAKQNNLGLSIINGKIAMTITKED